MKNLVIGIFVLGLTSLGFSQNTNSDIEEEVQLEGVVISNANLNYLEEVQDTGLSDNVISLEKEASVFDVQSLRDFDGRKAPYQVKFVATKGFIIADYDHNGKIIKTSERFRNINLPKDLIKSVLKQYPQSSFIKVVYMVDYDAQKDVQKTYRIKILDEGKKRNLKISSDNNFGNVITMN